MDTRRQFNPVFRSEMSLEYLGWFFAGFGLTLSIHINE